MLEAKDTTSRCFPSKKKVFDQKNRNFREIQTFSYKINKQMKTKDLQNFPARFLTCSSKKNGHDLGPFSTNQKIVLSSSREQGILQDLQASRPRRTSPLDCRSLGRINFCYVSVVTGLICFNLRLLAKTYAICCAWEKTYRVIGLGWYASIAY